MWKRNRRISRHKVNVRVRYALTCIRSAVHHNIEADRMMFRSQNLIGLACKFETSSLFDRR